jgi:hypothetical protein
MCWSGAWIREALPFDPGLGGEVGEPLERGDELGPAIGIARIIERIDADEQVARAARLGKAEREAEEDGVARRHVGDRNALAHAFLGHGDVGGQRRAAEGAQVERKHDVPVGKPLRCASPPPARPGAAGHSRSSARAPHNPPPAPARRRPWNRARPKGGRRPWSELSWRRALRAKGKKKGRPKAAGKKEGPPEGGPGSGTRPVGRKACPPERTQALLSHDDG